MRFIGGDINNHPKISFIHSSFLPKLQLRSSIYLFCSAVCCWGDRLLLTPSPEVSGNDGGLTPLPGTLSGRPMRQNSSKAKDLFALKEGFWEETTDFSFIRCCQNCVSLGNLKIKMACWRWVREKQTEHGLVNIISHWVQQSKGHYSFSWS